MTFVLSDLGYTFGLSGQTQHAEEIIRQFEEKSRSGYVSCVQQAWVHVGLGHTERAVELFEKAYQMQDPLCLWLNAAPHFDCLHSDRRFVKLLESIGLPVKQPLKRQK
jgi:hypothetical protein